MGLVVVGEGIETEMQLDYLRQHGCDQGQGYLVSKPLPQQALFSYLEQQARLQTSVTDVV